MTTWTSRSGHVARDRVEELTELLRACQGEQGQCLADQATGLLHTPTLRHRAMLIAAAASHCLDGLDGTQAAATQYGHPGPALPGQPATADLRIAA
jgi:hypothetical protein